MLWPFDMPSLEFKQETNPLPAIGGLCTGSGSRRFSVLAKESAPLVDTFGIRFVMVLLAGSRGERGTYSADSEHLIRMKPNTDFGQSRTPRTIADKSYVARLTSYA
jgi:hypothetical protein